MGKQDFGFVKSYRVISLLNCLGKVVEKVVAGSLSQYCETYSKLHIEQMGARKQQCTIDAVNSLIYRVQESWAEKKLAMTLFIDVKGF